MEKHHILGLFILIILVVFLFMNYTYSGVFGKKTPRLCTDSDSTPINSVNDSSFLIPGVVTAGGVTYPDRCDSKSRTRMFEGFCDGGNYGEIEVSCSLTVARYRCLTANISEYPNGSAYCGPTPGQK